MQQPRRTVSHEIDYFASVIPSERMSGLAWAFALGAFLVFLVLTISYSFTRGPWWDEGLFADMAINFQRFGHLGNSVLAPHTYLDLPEVNRYTYWQFPLYLVSLGTWFHLVPATVQSMRIFSVLWGCIYAGCWFLFVRALTRNTTLALFVTAVVSLDYSCVAAASDGRMEMMCAALGEAALAAYVGLREVNRKEAALVAGILGAASLFCHPMGAVTNAFLMVLIVRDWRRISLSSLTILTAPYVAGGLLCLWYILQAPQIFLAQYKTATGYRVGGLVFVLRNVGNDFLRRYISFYFERLSGFATLKICALLFGIAGFVSLLVNRRLRGTPLVRTLLLFSVIGYLGVAAIDDMKFPYYLIYVTPVLSACGAVWVYDSLRVRGIQSVLASALLVASFGATITAFARNIYRDDFKHTYDPAIAVIKKHLGPGDIVMGPSQLGFALGFGPPLIDDCFLGYVSGIQPKLYVMHEVCSPPIGSRRPWTWSRRVLASQYHSIFSNKMYRIYIRNSAPLNSIYFRRLFNPITPATVHPRVRMNP